MTTDRDTLIQLAAEAEALQGPSREMDAQIEDTIGPSSERPGSHLLSGFYGGRANWLRQTAPLYTSSVDAGLALLREVLPGWGAEMHVYQGEPADVLAWSEQGKPIRAQAPTLPLALVAAVLRAVAGREGAR